MRVRRLTPAVTASRTKALLALVLSFLGIVLGAGCLKREVEPFRPLRPWLGPELSRSPATGRSSRFPERFLFQERAETPPRTLLRLSEIFQQISSLPGPEPEWRLPMLQAELDSIRAEYDRLDLPAPSPFPFLHDDDPRPDRALLRRAASLEVRWGLLQMRTGEVNQRVWGAERLERAMRQLPDDPIPLLVYASYQQVARYWSNETAILSDWLEEHGPNDLVELQLLRRHERLWRVFREPEELERAFDLAERLARRHGGWSATAPWLSLERARLCLEADSLGQAHSAAQAALSPGGEAPADPLTAAQAELLLGVLAVRRLEYAEAEPRFARAIELAGDEPSLAGLISWLQVPWDLLSPAERAEFDHQWDRRGWIERYWRESDPILATPRLFENRVEYERRVAEAWFLLEGVDPATPGPLSDPGQAVLRFGLPDSWLSLNQGALGGDRLGGDFAIQRLWRYFYLPRRPGGEDSLRIDFQDHGSVSRFTPVDSMVPPRYPRSRFTSRPMDREYRYESSVARTRGPDGSLRLVLCYDTFVPDYAVRYPLQGLVFNGTARVRTTLYKSRARGWYAGSEAETILDREHRLSQKWTFRRRSGSHVISDPEPGLTRIASLMELRDEDSHIVGFEFDNGAKGKLERFAEGALQASDLILLAPIGDSPPDPTDREPRPGWKIHGPDLIEDGLEPRASRLYLLGEPMAYYLEIYDLRTRRGLTDAQLATTLEHLREDGSEDYSVTTEGLSQSLVRFGIRQWNVARTVGLTNLQPGLYRLRLDITDRQAGVELTRGAVFRVVTPDEMAGLHGWDRIAPPDRPVSSPNADPSAR